MLPACMNYNKGAVNMPGIFSTNYVAPATSVSGRVTTIRSGLKVHYPGYGDKDELIIEDTQNEQGRQIPRTLQFTYSEIMKAQFSGKHPLEKKIADLRQDLLCYIKMRIEPGSATWFGDNRFAKLEQASKLLELIDDDKDLKEKQRELKEKKVNNQKLSEQEQQQKEWLYKNRFNLHKQAPGEEQNRLIGGNRFPKGMLSELALEISLRKLAFEAPTPTERNPINPLLDSYNQQIQFRPSDFKSKYPFTASQCYTIMSGLYKLVGSNYQLTLIDNQDGKERYDSYQFKNSDLHKKLKQHTGYDFTQETKENEDHLRQVESYIVDRCQRCYHPFRTADTLSQKLSLAIELAKWLKQADECYRNNSTISNQLISIFHLFIYEPALKLDKKLDNGHLKADKVLGKLIEKIGQAYLKDYAPNIRQIGEDLFADIQNQSLTITLKHSDLLDLKYQFQMINPQTGNPCTTQTGNSYTTQTGSPRTTTQFFTNNEHDATHNQLLHKIESYIAKRIEGNSTHTPEKHYNKLKLAIELAGHLKNKSLSLDKFNEIHQRASDLDNEKIGNDRFPTKELGQEICHIGHKLFPEQYRQRVENAQDQEQKFQQAHACAMSQVG